MRLLNNKHSYYKYFLLPFFILIIILSFSGKSVSESFSGEYTRISGNVISKEGKPLKDFKVLVYNNASEFSGDPLAISSTKSNGAFKCKVLKNKSYIIEVQGESGTGRIFVPEDEVNAQIKISYPIIEKIIILHTNDRHFDINLQEEKAEMIKEIRHKYNDVFLMDAGDILVRHPARWTVNGNLMEDPRWYGKRGKEMISSMNELNYDVMTLGNHELAIIEPYTEQALETAHFPLLAANVAKPIKGLPSIDDFVIFETSTGRKLAVLGLSGNANVPETVNKYSSLKNSSDIFMALTHIGFKNDSALAVRFPVFDLIVGGHSHTLLKEAVMINNVLIAQAGGCPHYVDDSHPMYLGIIELILENGVLKNKSGKVFQLSAKK